MRSLGLLATVLAVTAAPYAFAADAQEQAPAAASAPFGSATAPNYSSGHNEWPASQKLAQRNAPANPNATISAPVTHTLQAPAQAAPAGVAADVAIDSAGGGAIPMLPLDVMKAGDIVFVNGGIGDEERAALKAREKEFNVHVLLSAPKGEFISDVTLRILDDKGAKLVEIADAGPYFYAQLPAGTYWLETTSAKGETKKIKLAMTGKNSVKQHVVYSE